MSSDSVSFYRSTGYSSSSSSQNLLSDDTREKLEELGVSTSGITTESEGQNALKEAQAKQETKKTTENPLKGDTEQSVKDSAKTLAKEMKVIIDDKDTTEDILKSISFRIIKLSETAGNDQVKNNDIEKYKIKLKNISVKYANIKTSRAQLANSMDGLASYNKIYQNLDK